MTALLSLLTIGIVLFILLNASRVKQPKKPTSRESSPAESYSSFYSGSQSDFDGEGSSLIGKFAGKKADYDLDWLLDEGTSAKPKKRQRSLVKSPVTGSIAFDYIDTKQEFSSRIVNTKEVDALHISGYCKTARAFRTFLIEGIVSDITDTDTGEVMPVAQWIRQAKKAAKSAAPKK